MKRIIVTIIAIAYVLVTPIAKVYPGEIIHLSLDEIDALGTKIEKDSKIKIEGDGSVKISTKWPTTINLGEIDNLNIDNAKLVYEAKVKSDNLNGTAYLEMWCTVDGGQYFSRGMNSTVTGTLKWHTLTTLFLLQKGQKVEKTTLNIVINGSGTIWIDDIRLYTQDL